jgi:cytochrome c peroxidase
VFNHRNFWDGRASNVFNGSSAWGDRDPDAGVWIDTPAGLVKQRLHLVNSALAAQAVAPPLNEVEMSCQGRRFADLARKLMWRRPLERQVVHPDDSVLGAYAFSTATVPRSGLNTFYYNLVREAFNAKYWRSTQRGGVLGSPPRLGRRRPLPYDQFEANFAMFFALALQLYQSTLVSDDSPFDRSAVDADGVPTDLDADALAGLEHFRTAHCSLCHLGPTLSSAAVVTNAAMARARPEVFGNTNFAISTSANVVTRLAVLHEDGNGNFFSAGAIIDIGFASNGVIQSRWDVGVGGVDPFGNPLSYARQYLQLLAGNSAGVVDADVLNVRPCDFDTPIALNSTKSHPQIFTDADGIEPQQQGTEDCFNPFGAFVPTPTAAAAELANPQTRRMRDGVTGAFKIPGLRNVELTGPYMHNGGMASLEEVLEFYTRGGNFKTTGKHFGFVFPQDDLRFDAQKRSQIVAFLKTLTDDRVRFERAPFDHPQLFVPHGHAGEHLSVMAGHALGSDLARDEMLVIPAVGAAGRDLPLEAFEDLLDY